MSHQPDNIFAGTQVVSLVEARGTNNSLAWRKELHHDFERALAETQLPERPDYEKANEFLTKARRQMVKMNSAPQLSTINHQLAQRQPPDYEAANRPLIKARREMAGKNTLSLPQPLSNPPG